MADYISTLTGVQVDAALLDMAEHNSEAYAVGARNGVAVASGDVTYHNNAKYYAQNASSSASTASSASSNANTKANQAATSATNAANSATAAANSATNAANFATAAEDAADRAEAIVGGQFVSYGQEQGLTDAQKEIARSNIGATPNKNLLDNWYFVGGGSQQGGNQLPINQRGQTSYSGVGYCIDRWRTSNTYGTLTIGSNYITFANTSSSNTASLYQDINAIPAGTYTLSARVKNGTVIIGYYRPSEDLYYTRTFTVGDTWTIVSQTFTSPDEVTRVIIRRSAGVAGVDIAAVKLEEGSVSTLSSDIPPVYSEELARCIYSTEDPTDTYANAGYGTSNRNLLDNWYFVGGGSQQGGNQLPINQRGQTSYTGNNDAIDRWRTTSANATLQLYVQYVSLTAASGGNAFLIQYTDVDYEGTYTYSAYIRGSGSGYVGVTNRGRSTVLSSKTFSNVGNIWTLISGTVTTSGEGIGTFTIRVNAGTNIQIESVKLEKGITSTLPNDSLPSYTEQLTKCKAYFERIGSANRATYGYFGTGVAYDTTHAIIIVPMTPKIGDFSITSGGSFRLNNGGAIPVTSLEFSGSRMTNTAGVLATASGLTAGSAYLLQANNDSTAYIDITSTVFD